MSTDQNEIDAMATKPVPEHEWLNQLVGEWNIRCEMNMGPDKPTATSEGTETVSNLGGLWSLAHGKLPMPNGEPMEYFQAIGYDVSFKQYRGCWYASASSHLWKYIGEMSEDGKTLTMNCEGPDMVNEGKTANYRDVIQIVDANQRTMTSYGEQEDGSWQLFMKSTYTRA